MHLIKILAVSAGVTLAAASASAKEPGKPPASKTTASKAAASKPTSSKPTSGKPTASKATASKGTAKSKTASAATKGKPGKQETKSAQRTAGKSKATGKSVGTKSVKNAPGKNERTVPVVRGDTKQTPSQSRAVRDIPPTRSEWVRTDDRTTTQLAVQPRVDEKSGPGVRVGDDIVMQPNGHDAGGCQRYSMNSRGYGSVQAVFYRTTKGDFTTDRSEANCKG